VSGTGCTASATPLYWPSSSWPSSCSSSCGWCSGRTSPGSTCGPAALHRTKEGRDEQIHCNLPLTFAYRVHKNEGGNLKMGVDVEPEQDERLHRTHVLVPVPKRTATGVTDGDRRRRRGQKIPRGRCALIHRRSGVATVVVGGCRSPSWRRRRRLVTPVAGDLASFTMLIGQSGLRR
jgi:hypothetical protein